MRIPFQHLQRRHAPGQDSAWHSTAYHRHFEGYVETRVPKPNGCGTRIERIYRGPVFTQDITDDQWKWNRVGVAAFGLSSIALYFVGATLRTPANGFRVVEILETLSLLGLLWMLRVLTNYLTAPRCMSIGCYRSTTNPLVHAARAESSLLALTALVMLIVRILAADGSLSGWCCIGGFLLSGVAVFLIGARESAMSYRRMERRKDDLSSDDGVEICR